MGTAGIAFTIGASRQAKAVMATDFNFLRKETIMKRSHKLAAGVIASLGLGMAVATAFAQPGQMGGGMGPHAQGGMQHGAMAGMQHGTMAGMQHGPGGGAQHTMAGGRGRGGMSGGAAAHGAGPELMTQEERSAMIERMRNATTPEERQKIIAENRAEMEKRAKEKGITLPEHRGPHAGFGPRAGNRPQAPATN